MLAYVVAIWIAGRHALVLGLGLHLLWRKLLLLLSRRRKMHHRRNRVMELWWWRQRWSARALLIRGCWYGILIALT